jgi:signal transduction histidine kinase
MSESFANDLDAIARIDAVQKILEVVCRITGLGFSAVARVTEARWIACAVRDEIAFGLQPGGELKVETTICDEIRRSGQVVAIDHVAEDEVFCGHATPKMYGFQSYISVPITLPDGRFFGTLCAIDPKPARVNTPEILGMFKLFADLIGMHLDGQERMVASEAALSSERETAKLREQFIAVLGHDLRNPLAAIQSGAQLLRKIEQNEESAKFVAIILRSASRMGGLIDNVLDFARGRLGSGLDVHRVVDSNLEAVLEQAVTELRMVWPGRMIHVDIAIAQPVSCDSARLAQMLSNLLANALTHGDPETPVWVRARTSAGKFELLVTNRGQTIPPHIVKILFEPFARGVARPGQQGLGLGLYIGTEIARAHQGLLEVASSNGETCFTFRMPISVE